MNRRMFAQSIGSAAVLSAVGNAAERPQLSGEKQPGKIMAIAAHPGDALFTMGAVVAQQIARGGKGVFLNLSLGERGAPKDIPIEKYGEMQRTGTDKAARLLGAESAYLIHPDAQIPFNEESSLNLCDAIREHKPDIVVTHWSGSWHKDHQNCHLMVHDAIFYAALATLERKLPAHSVGRLYYAENWEDATDFLPDVYIDIEPVYEKWMQACDFYPMWRGQTGFFRYNEYYGSLATMRGCLSNFKRAMALMSDSEQRTKRLQSL